MHQNLFKLQVGVIACSLIVIGCDRRPGSTPQTPVSSATPSSRGGVTVPEMAPLIAKFTEVTADLAAERIAHDRCRSSLETLSAELSKERSARECSRVELEALSTNLSTAVSDLASAKTELAKVRADLSALQRAAALSQRAAEIELAEASRALADARRELDAARKTQTSARDRRALRNQLYIGMNEHECLELLGEPTRRRIGVGGSLDPFEHVLRGTGVTEFGTLEYPECVIFLTYSGISEIQYIWWKD